MANYTMDFLFHKRFGLGGSIQYHTDITVKPTLECKNWKQDNFFYYQHGYVNHMMLKIIIRIYTINLFKLLLSLQERTAVLAALAEKARLTEQIFNEVPGVTCNPVQGAMYTFPRIALPQKAIDKAKV